MKLTSIKNGMAATFIMIAIMLLFTQSLVAKNSYTRRAVEEPLQYQGAAGTPELVVSRLLKLYPNPNSTDEVNIKGFTKNTSATILIKNAIGYIVMDEKTYTADDKGDINLKIHSLQQGHYYISIKIDKAQVIKKLIKI
ncbi:T9SS type A sorting domain-containing protein [Rufibacter hautae]|uniref:T9SS type A sorting domain-containing protein n=1 Tax=Rufibacter hautae TaxID=2595005 RepID=A0A5B6TG10_9BACT|nr:T9SS type A sorting domain-containing protein [Rufibacter hautae]KAA3438160.1 T9SS type A sorting domain-containing protein [Rufibacter hautae]